VLPGSNYLSRTEIIHISGRRDTNRAGMSITHDYPRWRKITGISREDLPAENYLQRFSIINPWASHPKVSVIPSRVGEAQ
jgi:hypothetical protein